MADHSTNVLDFVAIRRQLAERNKAEGAMAEGRDQETDLEAIAVCLEYLHSETRRLKEKTAGRLIGAAAECLRQEIRDQARRRSP